MAFVRTVLGAAKDRLSGSSAIFLSGLEDNNTSRSTIRDPRLSHGSLSRTATTEEELAAFRKKTAPGMSSSLEQSGRTYLSGDASPVIEDMNQDPLTGSTGLTGNTTDWNKANDTENSSRPTGTQRERMTSVSEAKKRKQQFSPGQRKESASMLHTMNSWDRISRLGDKIWELEEDDHEEKFRIVDTIVSMIRTDRKLFDSIIETEKEVNFYKEKEIQRLEAENQKLKAEMKKKPLVDPTPRPTYASVSHASYGSTSAYASAASMSRPARDSTIVRLDNVRPKDVADLVKQGLAGQQRTAKAVITVTATAVRVETEKGMLEPLKQHLVKTSGLENAKFADRNHLMPQVRIEGCDDFADQKQFIEHLRELNGRWIEPESAVVNRTVNRRDSSKFDVVIAVRGHSQRKLLEMGSLLVGFSRCRVYEHLRLRQCLNCLAVGHKKDQCRACPRCKKNDCKDRKSCKTLMLCFKCGGDHARKDCTAATPSCYVCKHHGRNINGQHTKDHCEHPMLGRDCPLRKIGEEDMRKKTDYA